MQEGRVERSRLEFHIRSGERRRLSNGIDRERLLPRRAGEVALVVRAVVRRQRQRLLRVARRVRQRRARRQI